MIDLGQLAVRALARPVNLKNQSIDIIQQRYPNAVFSGLAEGTIKGRVGLMRPPSESVAAMNDPANIRWIVLPKYAAGSTTQFSPLSPPRAMMQLADNAMNYSIHGKTGFQVLGDIVDAAQSYTLIYSDLDDVIAKLDRMANGEDL